MIGLRALVTGAVVFFGRIVLADSAPYTEHVGHRNSTLLSNLIKDFILDPHGDICTGNTLNGGFMTLNNGNITILDNGTVNEPIFLIRCSNLSEFEELSPILQNFSNSLSNISTIDDSSLYVSKDPFEKSVLMITFASCAVCIGTWMLYLVIILLPAENHNGRRFSVQFYVLFTAIYEAAMLGKSISNIFEKQYRENYQDAFEVEVHIFNSTAYRVGEIISSLMNFLNWIAIIFYMFHSYTKLRKNWLPSILSNRNGLIIHIGLTLTIIDTTLFAVSLWNKTAQYALMICYKTIDYIIYTLFCGLTVYFISHDFWFVVAPKRVKSNEQIGIKSILLLIWKDYHETIPLLVYNMTLFVLLYFTSLYFTIQNTRIGQWRYKVVKFLRLLITVSVWGLIDVLERRELILSRETILGRKIHNNDEYFFDPRLPCSLSASQDDSKSRLSRSRSENSLNDVEENTGRPQKVQSSSSSLSVFVRPLRVWKSQVRRARNLKNYSRAKNHRLLDTLTGKKDKYAGYKSKGKNQDKSPSHSERVISSDSTQHHAIFTNHDKNAQDVNEQASVETELARNYIYDYNNDS
ncbi:hypothetical protein HG535_0H02450 [Zygotorulaspora mrakii]|uniref:Protein DFG16 n=1 Tax=Zygotorulaspora mrakii TaxID=42260 RepID=A0A7H9B838_ZYGMR|nr:uncharacterized protein HG535_0H02450 [Zygotorulaspora mrakii]QLG74918.1 hypothetical protein HG535_0H02450 [Zygotorulaspora mrakii]